MVARSADSHPQASIRNIRNLRSRATAAGIAECFQLRPSNDPESKFLAAPADNILAAAGFC
jgi:hypothetical protein